MDRRTFLATAGAAVLAPALPYQTAPIMGLDFASGPDQTVMRMLAIHRDGIREVHRVIGVPRYQMGSDGVERDTWQEQIDAGLSELIETEPT